MNIALQSCWNAASLDIGGIIACSVQLFKRINWIQYIVLPACLSSIKTSGVKCLKSLACCNRTSITSDVVNVTIIIWNFPPI